MRVLSNCDSHSKEYQLPRGNSHETSGLLIPIRFPISNPLLNTGYAC